MSAETLPGPAPTDPHAEHRRPLPAGAPSHIGRYELLRELGTGTFGRVYYAHDPRLRRYVAVKVPREQLPPDRHEKFLEEGRTIAGILHENICPVYDAEVDGEIPFIVMRYVATTLDEVLKRDPLAPERALVFAVQVARALEAAHTKGVIHRDLKPSNLLYDEGSGQLLLADFGIARFLDSASVTSGGGKGTPLYMAPEQWDPEIYGEITARTDVYSLGCLLYQMLTGKPPFDGTPGQLLHQHLNKQPRDLVSHRHDLDERFQLICWTAMAKAARNRYPSARAFAEAIEHCLRTPIERAPVFVAPNPPQPRHAAQPIAKVVGRVPVAGETCEAEIATDTYMTFCWVPAGVCRLGAPRAESKLVELSAAEHESEAHRAEYSTTGFWFAKYPVTQKEWLAVMRLSPLATPSWFRPGGRGALALGAVTDTAGFPVESVSWFDCQLFLDYLNRHAPPSLGDTRSRFALPHEDEWEYACRGGLGNHRLYYFGNELNGTQANCNGTTPLGTTIPGPYFARTTPVGNYERVAPHPWGLCDIHGNVWEWCENLHDDANSRVLRGGAYDCKPHECRSARRFRSKPGYRFDNCGVRLCLRPC